MLGVRTRIAGLVAGIAGYVLLAQDAFGYFHHLHLLYLGAILFALVDADAAIALRPTPARSPASSLLLMRAFTASIYIWAAVGKLASEWGTGRALALWTAGGWRFVTPSAGMRTLRLSDESWLRFDGGGWIEPATVASPAGGATIDSEARAAIAALILALVGHGLLI